MKNYYGENISFGWWCIRSIISATVATISMVIFVWSFLIYGQHFSSETLSNGAIRGVGAIIMFTPILIGWHSFLYFISYYFLRRPKKIVETPQLLKGLGLLFFGYVMSSIVFLNFHSLDLTLFTTLILSFVFMLFPLVLGFITTNGIEKFLDK
ncbi:hypothetical protein [Acinetobacter gyllenbergii]|uniref:hypothetical protein n=1 Tax=Acinetobacter gyllenbergii TaxID=134534 RepID=UPI0008069EC9|nr:hypothetical protein [Acinetobacter gyllenbergii]OBY73668.1 hypothetical protein NG55_13500 [Acinetobacter gyllenbergii]